MFLLLILLSIILVAVVIVLPYLTDLVSYKYEKKPVKSVKTKSNQLSSGYVPPDQQTEQTQAKTSGIRKITADDVPIKLKLKGTQVKRRKERLDVDSNPNNYDYDLDELINEVDDEPVKPPVKPPVKFTKDIV